jgi:hypothetical protein
MNLDLGNLINNNGVTNMEAIDLGKGSQTLSITLSDVLSETANDTVHSLTIDGDSQDKVTLESDSNNDGNADTTWTLGDFKTDAETGKQFQEVIGTSTEGHSVSLEINTQIHIDQH